MRFLIYILLLVLFVSLYEAKDLVVGTRVNNLLISTEKVVYRAIPLIKRDKDYTFNDPKQRIIKGIIARDLSRSDARATVTQGGLGATNVTIHFQSERGEGLNYLVLIFTKNS
ncbi:PREDICTED: probable salivary secreted peptide [Papilio xuthus]|uniref:Probable salivary secreted peptide n=1 Tax=Papilio xuthus TaxID=66420 RepID=A0AAJ6ZJU7_PAPXU|nr:PREDICTED: probable salivary secreted peptide [Papilio xuthus]